MALSWGWGFMRNAIASLACLVLLGCVSATGTMLSENTALVSAEASGPAYRDKVIHDVLAEAARLTTASGYRYFVVLTADDLTHTVTVRTPGRVLHNQPPRTSEAFGTYSGRAYATGGSSYMLPDRVEQHIRPAMDIIIRMYRPGEIEPADGVWDATAAIDPVTAE
jgi:hypothetical protein